MLSQCSSQANSHAFFRYCVFQPLHETRRSSFLDSSFVKVIKKTAWDTLLHPTGRDSLVMSAWAPKRPSKRRCEASFKQETVSYERNQLITCCIWKTALTPIVIVAAVQHASARLDNPQYSCHPTRPLATLCAREQRKTPLCVQIS